MIKEKIILDMLTDKSVSVVKTKVVVQDGVEYEFGDPMRRAYTNTEDGIEDLKKDIPEPYLGTVLKLWDVI